MGRSGGPEGRGGGGAPGEKGQIRKDEKASTEGKSRLGRRDT